jgi:hypothetical protein
MVAVCALTVAALLYQVYTNVTDLAPARGIPGRGRMQRPRRWRRRPLDFRPQSGR